MEVFSDTIVWNLYSTLLNMSRGQMCKSAQDTAKVKVAAINKHKT